MYLVKCKWGAKNYTAYTGYTSVQNAYFRFIFIIHELSLKYINVSIVNQLRSNSILKNLRKVFYVHIPISINIKIIVREHTLNMLCIPQSTFKNNNWSWVVRYSNPQSVKLSRSPNRNCRCSFQFWLRKAVRLVLFHFARNARPPLRAQVPWKSHSSYLRADKEIWALGLLNYVNYFEWCEEKL